MKRVGVGHFDSNAHMYHHRSAERVHGAQGHGQRRGVHGAGLRSHGILYTLYMVSNIPYTWFIIYPIHGILYALDMVYYLTYTCFFILYTLYIIPYTWYIIYPIHGILHTLYMVYYIPYTRYII